MCYGPRSDENVDLHLSITTNRRPAGERRVHIALPASALASTWGPANVPALDATLECSDGGVGGSCPVTVSRVPQRLFGSGAVSSTN